MKRYVIRILPLLDIILSPFICISALLMWLIRRVGVRNMRLSRYIFLRIGVFPIRNHYYEPLFNHSNLKVSLRKDRFLPGINLNIQEQLKLINKFNYNNELTQMPIEQEELDFYYHNGSYESGDAEYLYNMIRFFKPSRIIEIGSGNSTLMAIRAVKQNMQEDSRYNCEHFCIEPYEMKWLEKTSAKVIRSKVEDLDNSFFNLLEENDILFIDSSHIIRPQGDVLFEYLELLPELNPGVIVHIHDIFSPKDYLDEWVLEDMRFWNEQYLLEAFLSCNKDFRIIGALNFLKHNYFQEISKCCPILKMEPYREPGAFWMVRN